MPCPLCDTLGINNPELLAAIDNARELRAIHERAVFDAASMREVSETIESELVKAIELEEATNRALRANALKVLQLFARYREEGERAAREA